MLQKQSYGKIKLFFKKINSFFSNIIPKYQLSFDNDYFSVKEKEQKYRFKSFGDHAFPEFTFKEIKYTPNILYSINPYDLIKITEKNYLQEYLENQLKIDEYLRGNLYKLSNKEGTNVFSGDEICDNPLLMEQLFKNDLFKIAYNTGFERGRKLFKLINQEDNIATKEKNIIELKCVHNKSVYPST